MDDRERGPGEDRAPRDEQRRSFLKGLGAMAAGALAGITPVLAGAATLLDPLRRPSAEGDMVMVTKLSAFSDANVPRRMTVSATRTDAWTTHQDTPVGAVYVRRAEDGISVLSAVCPHAGCFINLRPDRTGFACPCHRSAFALDGARLEGPSPRDMDALEVEIRNEDEIWVRFQSFRPGIENKVPIL
jgi:menaquinol-cytochrome c reductase iron-sulfur subunit